MLSRLFRRKEPILSGAPATPRLKTYSAGSGYVYQYFYRGRRVVEVGSGGLVEYVFNLSADRGTFFPASVLLGNEALEGWQSERQRELSSAECFAIAKMALFRALDARAEPAGMKQSVRVTAADVRSILTALEID